MNYLKRAATPTQREPADARQVQNEAGGYVYATDVWTRLQRFLVLGSEGGSYYASERDLTREQIQVLHEALAEDGPRVVEAIAGVSEGGRAPKNTPAIFALAVAAKTGDDRTRKAAYEALPRVCRIGTHLFEFLNYAQLFGGWGRGMKRAIQQWYGRDVEQVAYQMVKYRQREGWTHADALRLAKPVADDQHSALYAWAVGKGGPVTPLMEGYERAQGADVETTIRAIEENKITREMVDPKNLTSPEVWDALLHNSLPYTALIRNLGTMSRVGLLVPGSAALGTVSQRLADTDALRKARVHPLGVLTALATYRAGSGFRSEWPVIPQVVDALDWAFYQSFGNVESSGKRILLGVDISGSMATGQVAGSPLSPRMAAAAMALVTAKTEPSYMVVGFTQQLVQLPVSPTQRLDDVVALVSQARPEGTDCAVPLAVALQNGWGFDACVLYTDNQTWAGQTHVPEMLRRYRQGVVPDAKLVAVGMVANQFSVVDPNDPGSLDVVGFDQATPALITDFVADRI